MDRKDLDFQQKTYCFTGKLAELKRTQAEREVRLRGGFTIDSITPLLDYLVIGSIPSPSWKHGDYGSKIEKAIELSSEHKKRPKLIKESVFMDALSMRPIIDNGEIDEKMIVYKFKFVEEECVYDHEKLEDILVLIQSQNDTFVSLQYEDNFYGILFEENDENIIGQEEKTKVVCRVIKKLKLNEESQIVADDLTKLFEGINGIDGYMHWYERKEGTASYIKLLREIPDYKRKKS